MIMAYRGKTPRIARSAFVAPNAVVIGDVEVGAEASIWFGAVSRGDNGPSSIGAGSNVQDNAVLHVSTGARTIGGAHVTIGHGAFLEDCVVEDGALIGSNAVVLNGARIGSRTLVAAGSVVAASARIPPEVVVAGAPAKIKKALDDATAHWVDHGGPEYVELSRSYLHQGIGDPEVHELIEPVI